MGRHAHPPPLPAWARATLALYPPAFRRRYRPELERAIGAVLARRLRRARLRLMLDLVAGAVLEWLDLTFRTESPLEGLTAMLDSIRREMRHAGRRLLHSPAFTVVTVATVALAVGANTAVFTLVDGVLLRPMPYEEPEELGFIWNGLDWVGIPRAWNSGPQVPFLRENATAFEEFAALRMGNVDLTDDPTRPARRVPIGLVTGNLFGLLGVDAALGRTLAPDEEGPGAPAVALVTHALWTTQLGSDPAVLGSPLWLEGSRYDIVGVLPPDFRFAIHSSLGDPGIPEVYVPLDHDLPSRPAGNHAYAVLARLADGATADQGAAELDALGAEFGERHYRNEEFVFRFAPLHPDLVKEARPALAMLLAAVGLVLAIACSNVATLFYGRALAGQRETAVRAAIGASGWARVGPLWMESALVALMGGVAGIAVAFLGIDVLLALAPAGLPRTESIAPDWRVAAFSLALSALVATAITALPMIRARRIDLTDSLRDGGRTGSERGSAQRAMVVAQVALSGVLLVGAGLMARTLGELASIDPGFATSGSTLATLRIPEYVYEHDAEAMAVFEQIRQRIEARPEVTAAGWTGSSPLSSMADQRPYGFGRAPAATGVHEDDTPLTDSIVASPGYFEAAGIEIIEGRGFEVSDTTEGAPVVALDETVARRFWPSGSAVGGEVLVQWWDDQEIAARVVAVVRHARLYDIRRDDRYQVYYPVSQGSDRALTLSIRSEVGAAGLAGALEAIVRDVDPRLGVTNVRDVSETVGDALSSWRFLLQLLATFAVVALTLAALGLFGVVSLSVERETRAIGIRMALGARAAEVGREVIGRGLRLVALGFLGALAGAVALGRLLESFLYGVRPLDLATLAGVSVVLLAVAAVAAWLPARRATRVSPMEAFRAE